MRNVWYDMMVDRCLDQVDELSDQEVFQLVSGYVHECESDSVEINIDEARNLAADYLFGLEMEDCA
jgi:hypothetical protein